VWSITPDDYKTGDLTGQGNTIPLTPLALELIGPRRPTKDSLIFPSETGEAYDEDAARQAVYRLFKVKGARAASATAARRIDAAVHAARVASHGEHGHEPTPWCRVRTAH
jgi:hypothetical protein